MRNFHFKGLLLVALITTALASCTNRQSPQATASYDTRWSQDGRDSVVHVMYQNPQDNSMSDFFMNYMLFRTLFSNGGYQGVYGYYNQHRSDFYGDQYYRNYVSRPSATSTAYKSTTTTNSPTSSYSSPSRSSNTSSSTNSPTRSSSYSSPSRR